MLSAQSGAVQKGGGPGAFLYGIREKLVIVGNRFEIKPVIFNGERDDRVRVAGLAVYDVAGSRPVDRIDQHFLNDGHVVNREGFMAGTEVENLALVTAVGDAAAEHFAALEPADEHQFVGGWGC